MLRCYVRCEAHSYLVGFVSTHWKCMTMTTEEVKPGRLTPNADRLTGLAKLSALHITHGAGARHSQQGSQETKQNAQLGVLRRFLDKVCTIQCAKWRSCIAIYVALINLIHTRLQKDTPSSMQTINRYGCSHETAASDSSSSVWPAPRPSRVLF